MRLCEEYMMIRGIILLGFCQGIAASIIADSSEACTVVQCFANPCDVNKCPAQPTAICKPNYCGGCFAVFYDETGTKLEDCEPHAPCKGGQVFKKCGSSCTATCDEPDPACTDECVAGCECPDTLPIWKEGTCVAASQCKSHLTPVPVECKSNMEYNECGSSCSPAWGTCSGATRMLAPEDATTTVDKSAICTAHCVKRCECPATAPLLHNRVCITADACPKDPAECTSWVKCFVNPCQVNKCSNHPDATCKPNYCGGCFAEFYDAAGTKLDDCTIEQTCSGGQSFKECGSSCVATCDNPNPDCIELCVPRCECPDDLPLWKDDKCVGVEQCDSTQCKSNMVFNRCGSACPPTCKDPAPVCIKKCVPGCECPAATPILLKLKGVCIAADECPEEPEPDCKGGMVFNECASACTATCAVPEPSCTFECKRRCECPATAPILHNGQCMPEEKCPSTPICEGGQIFKTCGMDCTRTCDEPDPYCTKQCVEKCECPYSQPIWHRGQCIPLDRCPAKEECSHKGIVYEVGQTWKPDPCTTCSCIANPTTNLKMGMCAAIKCAFPECETDVIYPKDQCCPVCADPCTHNGHVYELGSGLWNPDPCTTCTCLKSATAESGTSKLQKCSKIYCDILICETEIVWSDDRCCPYCAEECTYNGIVHNDGNSWKINDCTYCECVVEDGVKKQNCSTTKCPRPDPNCKPIYVPGQCCASCQEPCTEYDTATGEISKMVSWKSNPCTTCTCHMQGTTAIEECYTIDCPQFDCPYKVVTMPGECCPFCLKPCYSVDREKGELVLHEVGETWEKDTCTTCTCIEEDSGNLSEECNEIMCDIPICIDTELVYDSDVYCCPYCAKQCAYNGKHYEVGDSWKPDPCTTCSCEDEGANAVPICATSACAAPEPNCKNVYIEDTCCPICLEKACTMYDATAGTTVEFNPGEEWKDGPCTFCYCTLNAAGQKEEMCAVVDCAPLEVSCVPVYKPDQCCPTCAPREQCTLEPYTEHGHAIGKAGIGSDLTYTFECKPGYWFPEGSGHKAYCDKNGIPVYPRCEKVSIATNLVEHGLGTYLVEVSYSSTISTSTEERERRGLLCDDGWGNKEATLICKQHGYTYGRAVSLESSRDDFLLTQLSCPRDDDYFLQHCSVVRYKEGKLSCLFNEVAGLVCYNGKFEYKTSNMVAISARKVFRVSFQVTAYKYGKIVDLKRGVFKLSSSSIGIVTETATIKPRKVKVRVKGGIAYVKLKARKPTDYERTDCISVTLYGPSTEFDHVTEKFCFN